MAEVKKYLDLAGLNTYDDLAKARMTNAVKAVSDSVTAVAGDVTALDTNLDAEITRAKAAEAVAQNAAIAAQNDVDALEATVSGKADKATTLAGYGIADTYTKTETDAAIANAMVSIGTLKRQIVESLPDVSAANVDTIYMVPTSSTIPAEAYIEYMVINGEWEKIGDTTVDLTDYATKSYTDTAEADALAAAKTYTDSEIAALDTTGSITEAEINSIFEE